MKLMCNRENKPRTASCCAHVTRRHSPANSRAARSAAFRIATSRGRAVRPDVFSKPASSEVTGGGAGRGPGSDTWSCYRVLRAAATPPARAVQTATGTRPARPVPGADSYAGPPPRGQILSTRKAICIRRDDSEFHVRTRDELLRTEGNDSASSTVCRCMKYCRYRCIISPLKSGAGGRGAGLRGRSNVVLSRRTGRRGRRAVKALRHLGARCVSRTCPYVAFSTHVFQWTGAPLTVPFICADVQRVTFLITL
ncbi:hypothetical protein EVAR_74699_1 [Eumeta japonica]|uniref:Uncharacterized protein n=1 Tax=Eumeta variegata TaxID=151549 RepID=A0A4C1YP99_EUMVA|nr:hypothetical protein EVAR_74699_1 [Eumeta japonica]